MRSEIKLPDIIGRWRLYILELHRFPDDLILEYHISPDGKFQRYSGSTKIQKRTDGEITITPKPLIDESDTVTISFGDEHYDAWDLPNKVWHLERAGKRYCFKRIEE